MEIGALDAQYSSADNPRRPHRPSLLGPRSKTRRGEDNTNRVKVSTASTSATLQAARTAFYESDCEAGKAAKAKSATRGYA